jgi:leucyl-tRNA synthetase
MVQGRTFKTTTGQYVTKDKVVAADKNKFAHALTKEPLVVDWEKMSKSKYNGTDPQDIVDQYGVDFTRVLMLSFVHPRSQRNFTRQYQDRL